MDKILATAEFKGDNHTLFCGKRGNTHVAWIRISGVMIDFESGELSSEVADKILERADLISLHTVCFPAKEQTDANIPNQFDTLVSNLQWWHYEYYYYGFSTITGYYLYRSYTETVSAVKDYLLNKRLDESCYSKYLDY